MPHIDSTPHQRQVVARAIAHAAGLIDVHIRANGYQMRSEFIKRVGELIRKGTIRLWFTAEGDPHFAGGRKGGRRFYAMYLKTTQDRGHVFYMSDVVHESTHLGFAVQAGGGKTFAIAALDDEAMAFTVQAIYLHKRGVLPGDYADDSFLTAAHAVARAILSKEGQAAVDRQMGRLKAVLAGDANGYGNEKREYFDPEG